MAGKLTNCIVHISCQSQTSVLAIIKNSFCLQLYVFFFSGPDADLNPDSHCFLMPFGHITWSLAFALSAKSGLYCYSSSEPLLLVWELGNSLEDDQVLYKLLSRGPVDLAYSAL